MILPFTDLSALFQSYRQFNVKNGRLYEASPVGFKSGPCDQHLEALNAWSCVHIYFSTKKVLGTQPMVS